MAAIKGEPVDRVPVFPLLMFFAASRAGITYKRFATDGRAMADAQLSVQKKFGFDAITACSDAFRVSADLGGEMVYPEDAPPFLSKPLVISAGDILGLQRPDPSDNKNRMADRALAVSEMANESSGTVAVLGWVDMPFAEACSVCGVSNFMTMMVDDPAGAHALLAFLTKIVIDFALVQVEAGADMVGAGDAAASLISPEMYSNFALPYEQEVCAAVHNAGNLIKLHICGNTARLLPEMVKSGADLFNVDHLVPFALARDVYSSCGKCFKGNLNPVSQVMQATPEECAGYVRKCLVEVEGARFMLSAGCEIPAETPDEVFQAFCNEPQRFRAQNTVGKINLE
jgi:MtaA/CmuA family methyltransferase